MRRSTARAKYERTRMAVEEVEVELKNATVVGNKDAMRQRRKGCRNCEQSMWKLQLFWRKSSKRQTSRMRSCRRHCAPRSRIRLNQCASPRTEASDPGVLSLPHLGSADSEAVLYEPPREIPRQISVAASSTDRASAKGTNRAQSRCFVQVYGRFSGHGHLSCLQG